MPPRKRVTAVVEADIEPPTKRRSLRQAGSAPPPLVAEPLPPKQNTTRATTKVQKPKSAAKKISTQRQDAANKSNESNNTSSSRAVSPDPDPSAIPERNPEAVRHDGKWYWLLKAEPESRFEGGVDVKFSIDDLRERMKPEGWDGIRSYAARNNLRAMNAGDMAFFYHSNCKTPGIVGTMEIVREYSEDKSARRAGAPYYDPQSTRANPRWSLVHVEFRRKFAVPIYLPELRDMGKPGGPLEAMQLVKQSRLSVSRVSEDEWAVLCRLADEKAKEAGLAHEDCIIAAN